MKFTIFAMTAATAMAFAPMGQQQQKSTKLFVDPLWDRPESEKGVEYSKALPFVKKPKILDGSLPGDAGFDPFGFAGNDKASLFYMREAEIKHSRLAMLAVVGWPLSELWDKPIADVAGLKPALTKAGSAPSVLNGGLEKIDSLYWIAVILLAGIVELQNSKTREEKGKAYILGDCDFDPLGVFPKEADKKFAMQTKEIKHGRLAMMAILGFVVQEALYRQPVVAETPQFFKPVLL